MRPGSWTRCLANIAHKGVKVSFKKTPDYPHDYCEFCVTEIRKRNGTYVQPTTTIGNTTSAQMLHHSSCTPEKDSL